jgi:hypothetical protein
MRLTSAIEDRFATPAIHLFARFDGNVPNQQVYQPS